MNLYRPNRSFKEIHRTKEKAHKAKESDLGSETPPIAWASRDITYHLPYKNNKKTPNKNQNKHKEKKNRNKQTRLISYTRSHYVLQKQYIHLPHPQKYTTSRENKMGVKHKPDLLNAKEKQKTPENKNIDTEDLEILRW